MIRFSSRLPVDLAPNRLAAALAGARRDGRALIDLTESNPTRAGFEYPDDLLAPLAHPRALRYAPCPFGLEAARRAVAADYARRGVTVDPDRLVLTSSTSEAYSLLFKVLCDPGDEILVPRPSYPLFEYLAGLDAVSVRTYDLEYHGRWDIDVDGLERALTPQTRAVLLVSPNNPTGSFVKAAELQRIAACSASHGAAIIADEVFADYVLPGRSTAPPLGRVLDGEAVLTFSLGGLSKSVGLPQVKLGWIAVGGDRADAARALARLEVVCDTYLSVSTPAQAAAAELLERGASIRQQIAQRISDNYRHLVAACAAAPACHVCQAEGGWYAVLQVPSLGAEEDLVLRLLTEDRVLVHPGYFFDFPRESFLILSLLPPPQAFGAGLSRVLERVEPRLTSGTQSR
jgi:hypothetical protein